MKANDLAAIKERAERYLNWPDSPTILLLVAEVERLRGIVEKVAAMEPVPDCLWCDKPIRSSEHKPDCPYRLAVEYMKEEKGGDTNG